MGTLRNIDIFHKTKSGLLVFLVAEVGLVYLFGSLAINSGSAWEWTLVLVLLIGSFDNILKLIGKLIHGSH